MPIGKYCQITGERKRRNQIKAEVYGVTVTAPALMEKVYGEKPATREEVRAMVRFCAVCGAEQPSPLPEHCVSCGAPLTAEVGDRELGKLGEKPGLWERVLAFLIDLFIIGLLIAAVVWGLGQLEASFAEPGRQEITEGMTLAKLFVILRVLIAVAVFILYHTILVAVAGTTPGKFVFGSRVYLKNGSPRVGLGKAFIRSALYLFTIYVVPVGLLPLVFQEPPAKWVSILEKDAMFHDTLTDTEVIKTRHEA
ncbi:MAG: RDD family protein [bacterium]